MRPSYAFVLLALLAYLISTGKALQYYNAILGAVETIQDKYSE